MTIQPNIVRCVSQSPKQTVASKYTLATSWLTLVTMTDGRHHKTPIYEGVTFSHRMSNNTHYSLNTYMFKLQSTAQPLSILIRQHCQHTICNEVLMKRKSMAVCQAAFLLCNLPLRKEVLLLSHAD